MKPQYNINPINNLSIYITTLCNLHCAGCCAGSQSKNNITASEVSELAEQIGEIDDLYITGGEPTLHKHFRDIMSEVFKIKYKKIYLATNGYNLMKYIDMMDNFNEIRISHYTKDSYPNTVPNTEKINEFVENYKGTARVVVQPITLLQNNDKWGACARNTIGIASYFKGNIYGCCVSAGMDTAKGLPMDKNWRENAFKLELPCSDCVFAI
jgi:MoaA/NifB/PqqE/SkfB family radical SAM enzyme